MNLPPCLLQMMLLTKLWYYICCLVGSQLPLPPREHLHPHAPWQPYNTPTHVAVHIERCNKAVEIDPKHVFHAARVGKRLMNTQVPRLHSREGRMRARRTYKLRTNLSFPVFELMTKLSRTVFDPCEPPPASAHLRWGCHVNVSKRSLLNCVTCMKQASERSQRVKRRRALGGGSGKRILKLVFTITRD